MAQATRVQGWRGTPPETYDGCMTIRKLDWPVLITRCDPASLVLESPAQAPAEAAAAIVGQPRARAAAEFAIAMPHAGYHLFVSGAAGVGKRALTREAIAAQSNTREILQAQRNRERALSRALELAPTLPEAHAATGLVQLERPMLREDLPQHGGRVAHRPRAEAASPRLTLRRGR